MHNMASEAAHQWSPNDENRQLGRKLSENSMEYLIFVLDDNVEGIKYLKRLEAVGKEATRLAESVAKNYIWQRDEFNLEIVNRQGMKRLIVRHMWS